MEFPEGQSAIVVLLLSDQQLLAIIRREEKAPCLPIQKWLLHDLIQMDCRLQILDIECASYSSINPQMRKA